MFDHPEFERFQFNDVPLGRDMVVMDIQWASEFESEWLKVFETDNGDPYGVGYVSNVVGRSVGNDWLELSWYPNTFDRFHEVPIFLPMSAFVACANVRNYDNDPRIFVQSDWLRELHVRPMAAFAIVDADGIKARLQNGTLDSNMLGELNKRIDTIADRYPDIAFISFADSVLVKQAWSVGQVDTSITYTYSPEKLLPVVVELRAVFEEILGTAAYAIMTQGINAYSDSATLHHSSKGNHVSLNTLGLPFAQLTAIDSAARAAVRDGTHDREELYIDSMLFRSLKLKAGFDKNGVKQHIYRSPMTKAMKATYVTTSVKTLIENLR